MFQTRSETLIGIILEMRPLLNYYGSKWNAGEWIISQFPNHDIYAECFGGSAAVLLQKPRSSREVINDLDEEIVNLYQVVRNQGALLKKELELTPFSRQEYEKSFEISTDPIEKARRVCVRAYMGIGNSINRKTGMRLGTGSTTCTAKSWQSYIECLDEIVDRFKGVMIEHCDYRELIRRYDTPDTLFYLDPPYVMATRSCSEQYRHDWKTEDHKSFLDILPEIKGMALVSGYVHDSYDTLGWKQVKKEFKTQKKTKKTEVLWLSPNLLRHSHQMDLCI